MSQDKEAVFAELMARRVQQVSMEIQGLLHGLGPTTQCAILADLVSLWLAGHVDTSELGRPLDSHRPLTVQARAEALDQLVSLARVLVPESEKEIMQRVQVEDSA